MKQYSKKLFSLVVLCSTANITLQADNDGNRVVPFIQWRSQGRDTARKLYGTIPHHVYLDDMDDIYGTFNVTVQYDQSFRDKRLARALFGCSLVNNPATAATTTTVTNSCNTNCNNSCDDSCDDFLVISGLNSAATTPATTRGTYDWMAENFLLPRDFKSTISFSPKVQDVVVDFNLYVGLDRWVKGMYFRLYGPVAWNKASLRVEENILAAGVQGYTAGYFDQAAVPASSLFKSALSFFGGCQLPNYSNTTTGLVQEVVIQPLMFSKFSDCNLPTTTPTVNNCNKNDDCGGFNHHKTGFAELRGEFGYNYIQEKYRLMINIQAAAPTGTRPHAEFLFPAQVGNGKHWELGGGVGGSWKMWGSEDGDKSFNFIVEADVTHLFNAKQQRSFDLKCKPNSRYMLAEKLGAAQLTPTNEQLVPNNPVFGAPDTDSGVYAPVANFSTQNCKVSIGVQGDVVAMFNYQVRGFTWDLGYNFWGMSKSKIKLSCNDDCDNSCNAIMPFPANTWALKGDASVFGYTIDGGAIFGLGATENNATIFNGTNAAAGFPAALANPRVDNVFAAASAVDGPLFIGGGTVALPATVLINTSNPPVFIAVTDLDIEGAEQRGISNKVFTHFSYTWLNHDKYIPYFGAGFSAEFGSNSNNDDCPTTIPAPVPVPTTPTTTTTNNCNTNCSSSVNCALSKWAVEIKGGLSFH